MATARSSSCPTRSCGGQMQGGVCALPIPAFPTGIMRGRFNPVDGQLYTCGLFGWAGDRTQPGGFYRVRMTGKPLFVPAALTARHKPPGHHLHRSARQRKTPVDPSHFKAKTWSLKRTANYGSDHHDERPARIKSATPVRRWPHRDPRDSRLAVPPGAWKWRMRSGPRAANPWRG